MFQITIIQINKGNVEECTNTASVAETAMEKAN